MPWLCLLKISIKAMGQKTLILYFSSFWSLFGTSHSPAIPWGCSGQKDALQGRLNRWPHVSVNSCVFSQEPLQKSWNYFRCIAFSMEQLDHSLQEGAQEESSCRDVRSASHGGKGQGTVPSLRLECSWEHQPH